MNNYTDAEKNKDFNFFKNINKDYFSKHGHKFLAVKNQSVIETADDVPSLISKMDKKSFQLGTYLIQECTGDNSAYTTTVMRMMIKEPSYA